jgi:phosphatidylethanolamine/phosphatidyl-N-methylethanolamine N-methyltransferase
MLPGCTVLEGDARTLPDILPKHWWGRIGGVICGIPLVLLPKAEQARFISSSASFDERGHLSPPLGFDMQQ